jgi:hypothetical protein
MSGGSFLAEFVGGLTGHATQGLGFDQQALEKDRLVAIDALAVVIGTQAILCLGDRSQGLQIDVGQRLVDFSIAGALRRIVAVLQQQVTRELDARLVVQVRGHLPLQRLAAQLKRAGERGSLFVADGMCHAYSGSVAMQNGEKPSSARLRFRFLIQINSGSATVPCVDRCGLFADAHRP